MKRILFYILILIFAKLNAQNNRIELSDCNIFVSATYKNEENINKSILLKDFIKDTIITGTIYKKYKISDFEDLSKKHSENIIYESFENEKYIKLDKNLKEIHNIKYQINKQNAIFFGKNESIKLEYVDTRNSFPKDSLIPNEKTLKKFLSIKTPQNYFVILTDFKSNELEMNNDLYTKQLFGENVYKIAKNYKTGKIINNKFQNNVGDEIQIFYRRKWYNDKTGIAEYENKQFKNFKYLKDTLINNQNAIIIESDGYNYLSGREEQKAQFTIIKTDSSFAMQGMEIPIKNYGTEMKILPDNSILLQSVIENKIDGVDFPMITQFNSNSYYTTNILPYFPMEFLEVGNVEGLISYVKINGKEYGQKKERDFKKDVTSIWSINQNAENELKIKVFVKEKSKIIIELGKDESLKTVFNETLDLGEHEIVLKTEKLIPNKYYNLNLNYELKNGSGSIGSGFTAK